MASIDPSTTTAPTVKWRMPSIHPEGWKYVAISGAVTLIILLFVWEELGILLLALTVWIALFFRDPVRVTPQLHGALVAPADGLVIQVARVAVPPELAGQGGLAEPYRTRVSIFMSVFDVHINRTPITGTVTQLVYLSGKFLNADLDKASEENERQHIVFERNDGVRVGMTQIAGLVARRIVSFVKPGDMVVGGQRVGLIRFGSRVDLWLPEGYAPMIVPGQRSVAGETVIAMPGTAQLAGIAQ